jgi:predicted nucleic acid-binding protein
MVGRHETWIVRWRRPDLAESLLCDSSGILAAIDSGEPDHERVRTFLESDGGTLLVTDFVIAEVDYLVLERLGARAEQAFLEQIIEGVFQREEVRQEDLERAAEISRKYARHQVGLTDASLMALSERRRARRILTLDHRHFSMFRNREGKGLELVP